MVVERDREWTQAPALYGQSGTREIVVDALIRLPNWILRMQYLRREDEDKLMTVGELIAELDNFPSESFVYVDHDRLYNYAEITSVEQSLHGGDTYLHLDQLEMNDDQPDLRR